MWNNLEELPLEEERVPGGFEDLVWIKNRFWKQKRKGQNESLQYLVMWCYL